VTHRLHYTHIIVSERRVPGSRCMSTRQYFALDEVNVLRLDCCATSISVLAHHGFFGAENSSRVLAVPLREKMFLIGIQMEDLISSPAVLPTLSRSAVLLLF